MRRHALVITAAVLALSTLCLGAIGPAARQLQERVSLDALARQSPAQLRGAPQVAPAPSPQALPPGSSQGSTVQNFRLGSPSPSAITYQQQQAGSPVSSSQPNFSPAASPALSASAAAPSGRGPWGPDKLSEHPFASLAPSSSFSRGGSLFLGAPPGAALSPGGGVAAQAAPSLRPAQSFLAQKPAQVLDEGSHENTPPSSTPPPQDEKVFDLLTGKFAPPGKTAFSAASSTDPNTPNNQLATAQLLQAPPAAATPAAAPTAAPRTSSANESLLAAAIKFENTLFGAQKPKVQPIGGSPSVTTFGGDQSGGPPPSGNQYPYSPSWVPAALSPASVPQGFPALGESCNALTNNASYNGCAKAASTCPLSCTAQSQPGCGERFQCTKGCPLCKKPPPNSYCYNFKQVTIVLLDQVAGQVKQYGGELTHWFEGSVLHVTLELSNTMTYAPLAFYANRTAPNGPPPEQTHEGTLKDQARGDGWDILIADHTSCITYTKDFGDLYYGDQVYISMATFACKGDQSCQCKALTGEKIGGNVCIYAPAPGFPIPTSSPSKFLQAPYQDCLYVVARKCAPGFIASDTGDACVISGMKCPQTNACGSGPFPKYNIPCQGVNPEGADLDMSPRCATNAYDNQGYSTLDFTCDAAACMVDSDCLTGYMCAQYTPCLSGGNGTCTSRCVPAAASYCKNICPNALDSIPGPTRPTPSLNGLSGQDLTKALGAMTGSSAGRTGPNKWLRASDSTDPSPPRAVTTTSGGGGGS